MEVCGSPNTAKKYRRGMEKFIPLQPFKTGGDKLANAGKANDTNVYFDSVNAIFVYHSSFC